MPTNVNKIRNCEFRTGKDCPTRWTWKGNKARWARRANAAGIEITGSSSGQAAFSQEVACKSEQYYRVEADIDCDLQAAEDGGFCIEITGHDGATRRTPFLLGTKGTTTVRAYYESENAGQARVSVGVWRATGRVVVLAVRFVRILEPDEISHPLAVPPPTYSWPIPRVAKTVCVCTGDTERKLPIRLAEYFGASKVRTIVPSEFNRDESSDAVFLPDKVLPRSFRSLTSLKKLAQDRIIVISLEAFAKIAGDSVSLRRIEQPDDPIHAEVIYANHATCGFALQDVFAYAWKGKEPGSYRQNHFRKTKRFLEYIKRQGFVQILAAMCDRDETSHQPLALYHETSNGGLYVLDVEPIEVEPSTMDETVLAMQLLLNILGHTQSQLGQYVSPISKRGRFRDTIREFGVRFESVVVHDADVPSSDVEEQLVTVGRDDEGFGLPLKPKPVILVRSGLQAGDIESVYGSWFWLKQLIRPAPHTCPYADMLASRFRFAWIPCVAEWESGWALARSDRFSDVVTTIEVDANNLAALIDVVSTPVDRIRAVAPSSDGVYERYAHWLGPLFSAFGPEYFTHQTEMHAPLGDRRSCQWGITKRDVEFLVEPESFVDVASRDAAEAGATVIRLEVPGFDADFAAHSIERTDLTATLLELIVGMQYGLVAVNRRRSPIHFDGFAPIAPGEALIVDSSDAALRANRSRAG